MKDPLIDAPIIQEILDSTIGAPRRPPGLNYAVYATSHLPGRKGEPNLVILNRSGDRRHLEALLTKFAGPTVSADAQRALWDEALQSVHRCLLALDKELMKTGQGENIRVVLDIDMGGLYYTRLGTHAVLFGCTLDQAEVNNGRCEKEMHHMVSQIQAVFTAHGA
jgi:hypothetical protein